MLAKLAMFPITAIGLSLIVFAVMRVLPGDVVDAVVGEASVTDAQRQSIEARLGLDRPLAAQYGDWLWGLFNFDLGNSLTTGDPIAADIRERLPVTIELTVFALLISVFIGVPSGVICATYKGRPLDYIIRILSLLGVAIPLFWAQSLLRNYVLPTYFDWLPPAGYADIWEDPQKNMAQMWLPASTLGIALSAITTRLTRSIMLDVLREDYVRTARAKGLPARVIIVRHALRNGLLPLVTLIGIQFGFLLGGSVVTESIFGLPGIGLFAVESIRGRDYPVVQAIVLCSATIFLIINLVTDLAYSRLDPRVVRS
jgi:peptide/nickel transport system permease protein